MAEVFVRRFEADDLPAVLEGLKSRDPALHQRRLEHQSSGGLRCFVAWLDDWPIGYVGLSIHDDRSPEEMLEARGFALVEDLFVEEAHRRRGAGRALMSALEKEARAAGIPGITLDTGIDDDSAAARGLYRSMGYVDQGGVYLGGWSDPDQPGARYVDPLTTWRKLL
jgi:GNAT superfamily N-acetyltransferase